MAYVVHVDGVPREVAETIHLARASRHEGGRWWIQCPAQVDGQACGHRVGILYLPLDQQCFACRRCHDLSYPSSAGDKETEGNEMDEMSDMQRDQGQERAGVDRNEGSDAAGSALGEAPAGEPLRLRSFFYVDHALELLDPQNTALSEEGRVKLVDELLARMVGDDELPDERFSLAIPQIQSDAPEAFAASATRVLREGNFSIGVGHVEAYFPLHRLGKILRLYLVHDLQLERAADLLLLDAAIEAFVQARILLGRATPLSSENGPPPGDEKLFRSQAVAQQKLFMAAMDKLMPKPVRRLGRPPAKKTG